MEGVMKQWKEEEVAEVEKESLVKRQAHHQMHVTDTTITTSKLEVQGMVSAIEQTNGSFGLKQEQEIIQAEVNSGDIEKKTNLQPLDPVIHVDSSLFSSVRNGSETVGVITQNVQQQKELYLEELYQKTPTQRFYCPNCKICIQKVILLEETSAPAPPPPPPQPQPPPICSSCLGFLIPIGRCLFPCLFPGDDEIPTIPEPPPPGPLPSLETPRITGQPPDHDDVKNGGADTSDSSSSSSEIPQDEPGLRGSKDKPSLGARGHVKKPKQPLQPGQTGSTEEPTQLGVYPRPGIGEPTQPSVYPTPGIEEPTQPGVDSRSRSSTTWEILKSIVYGGLVEFIASLDIVTSSASAGATTLNILVLSLANLIGGLFIIINNMWDLKSETNARVDRYDEVLGKKNHFYLHVFIAILSFIIFGLVPPLLYAFTFTESNNKDLKLAAVAVASAICITLLSIAKAHIQRPNSYLPYLQTVLQYLCIGAMTSVVSYLAGELVNELIQKLGWFDTKSSSFTLLLPETSVEKPRFGSY